MDTVTLLERLVAVPTVSDRSNLALIHGVRDLLAEAGVAATLVPSDDGTKAGLLATVGPADRPGVMLSGHTDVVTAEGQAWTSDPFTLSERDGRLYGRGTADMKGFVACAVAAACRAARRDLTLPLHLALSYDEEIGCVGVRPMLEVIAGWPVMPALCIVGEPTGLVPALGHKGKLAAHVVCHGRTVHSGLAPEGLNAIHLAADLVGRLRERQVAIAAAGPGDPAYAVPYTTLHVGRIAGGVALNIVPDRATLDFEIRTVPPDDAAAIFAGIAADAEAIALAARAHAPEAAIAFEVFNTYPGLDLPADAPAARVLARLLGVPAGGKMPFGTEAGLFHERLGIPTVVCGPGSMAQGHKPDEFIARDQLAACDRMLDRLIDDLAEATLFDA